MHATNFYTTNYHPNESPKDATGFIIERMILNYLAGDFKNTHLQRAVNMINEFYWDFDTKGYSPLATLFHFLIEELTEVDAEDFQESTEYQNAKDILEDRANNGDCDAQYDLGFCYEEGLGTDINMKQAFEWYKKAAEQGNLYARYRVAHFYINDINKEMNPQKGLEILRKIC